MGTSSTTQSQSPVKHPKGKGSWYKHYITECPVCGRGEDIRERQYTPAPPKNSPERWDYNGMAYDYCEY